MKKLSQLLLMASFILVFAACSSKQDSGKNEIANPITDPVGYTQDMVDLNKDAQRNIQDSADKENDKINNTLRDNNMNLNQNASEDDSDLVKKYTAALIKTNMGDIKVKLYGVDSPVTVGNFLKLAQSGFYDGIKFHRVIKGFMIQGGDPNSKSSDTASWGMGGPGYKFKDELKGTEKYSQGTLAMANSGPNTNGSQFFIVTASPEAPLPPSYTVFGTVAQGLNVALKIENVKTETNDRPAEDVIIESVEVLEK